MILVVDNISSKLEDLRAMLTKLRVRYQVIRYDSILALDDFDGVILSGRGVSLPDSNKFNARIIRYAQEKDLPLLGICYGGEVIATAFGGSLTKLSKRIDGYLEVKIGRKNSLTLHRDSFTVYCKRRFQIGTLPKELVPLSSSTISPNEIVKHRKSNIYGLQFHPESSHDDGQFILQNFISLTT